jgi:hypothetical protein
MVTDTLWIHVPERWSGRCLLSHWMNAQGRMDLALLLYAALTLGRQTPLQTRPNTAAASPTPPRVPTPCAPLKRPAASSSPTILLLDAFLQFPLLPLPPLRFCRHGYLLHFLLAPVCPLSLVHRPLLVCLLLFPFPFVLPLTLCHF